MCKVEECQSQKIIARGYCQYHYDRQRRYGDLTTRPKQLTCEDCNQVFDVRRTGNLPVVCDSCFTKRHRAKQRADRRRKGLWELYKMTLDDYKKMHEEQQGKCLICNQKTKGRGEKKNQLAVDHCHETGKIRGLLCNYCNTGLGLFRDDMQLLKKAINYLKERG